MTGINTAGTSVLLVPDKYVRIKSILFDYRILINLSSISMLRWLFYPDSISVVIEEV